MILNKKDYQVKRTSTPATVPTDPTSRLRYFISCMVAVVPALNENGKLSEIIDYGKPLYLNNDGTKALIHLCRTLFAALNGKCILNAPELCNRGNQFYEITQINNIVALSEEVIIGGKVQNVAKIMTYKQDWIERNLFDPIRTLEMKKMTIVVNDQNCSVM